MMVMVMAASIVGVMRSLLPMTATTSAAAAATATTIVAALSLGCIHLLFG